MVDFLFFYEHVNREVENDTLVISELRKRGYSCELMPFDGPEYWWRWIFHRQAKVLVVPWLRTDTNIYHYLHLAKKPYKIVDLQWEQITNKAFRDMDILSDNSLKSYHLCWGQYSVNILKEKGIKESMLPIVGAIQQDFCRDEFSDYYFSKEELSKRYGLDPNKRWVLYISSFSYANVTDEYIDSLKNIYGNYIIESRKLEIETQKITLMWIEKFINMHDCEFIYRPHPTENASDLIQELKNGYRNFHVISDYSVKQWGKVSDSVNLWISTSNAELVSMNVNFHFIRPIMISVYREMESMFGEEFISDYLSFEAANLEDRTQHIERLIRRKNHLKLFYDFMESIPAYIRVSNELEKILKDSNSINYKFTLEQKRKSKKIHLRTLLFSFFTWVNLKSKKFFNIFPIQNKWRDIVNRKSEIYKYGLELENKVLEYIRQHE